MARPTRILAQRYIAPVMSAVLDCGPVSPDDLENLIIVTLPKFQARYVIADLKRRGFLGLGKVE